MGEDGKFLNVCGVKIVVAIKARQYNMYNVNTNPAPWLMLCSLGSAPLDATRVLACLLACLANFRMAIMLSFSSFSAFWILVIVRAVVFKGEEGDQCPLPPRSSFMPMTGSGASGWSSFARLLLLPSSFREIAWLPSLSCSWSFMPDCAFADCGSCGDRFTGLSSLDRPSQPGVLSGALARETLVEDSWRRVAGDAAGDAAEDKDEDGGGVRVLVLLTKRAVLETETRVQGSRGIVRLGWVGLG